MAAPLDRPARGTAAWLPLTAAYLATGSAARLTRHSVLLPAAVAPAQARRQRGVAGLLLLASLSACVIFALALVQLEHAAGGRAGAPKFTDVLPATSRLLVLGQLAQLRAAPGLLQLPRVCRGGLLPGWDTTSRGGAFAASPMGRRTG